eukprot:scaffold86_cov75-Phaeocystis_antarctica.AAC.1
MQGSCLLDHGTSLSRARDSTFAFASSFRSSAPCEVSGLSSSTADSPISIRLAEIFASLAITAATGGELLANVGPGPLAFMGDISAGCFA